MLLKYPEMLWALLALLIPILVHLLRLRKFRKTLFTNVRVLQRLRLESDRSSRLKKWLLLLARLGLIAALVFAFAQPYKAQPGADSAREVVLYLDNSLSMEHPSGATTLLQEGIQEILQTLPGNFRLGLVTNTRQYGRQELRNLSDVLLNLEHTHQQTDLATVVMRAQSVFGNDPSVRRELWMVSDFQGFSPSISDTTALPAIRAAVVEAENNNNISLDSVYIASQNNDILELRVDISLQDPGQNQALSLYNGDTLIAKTAAELDEGGRGYALFTLPARSGITGTVQVLDEGFPYDNTLYFHLGEPRKIRVLSLGPGSTDYLRRIYTEDEFEFLQTEINTLDFGRLQEQDLIILNGLETIPGSISRLLSEALEQGAKVLVVPPVDLSISSYNEILEALAGYRLEGLVESENRISEIRFDHPLLQGVFESEVANFEYPLVRSYYRVRNNRSGILEFQDGNPFLLNSGNFYMLTASVERSNSNLQQSPLIVPVFYAIGRTGQLRDALYYTVGNPASLTLDLARPDDRVYQLRSEEYSFIPEQQRTGRRTQLRFSEEPRKPGIYRISDIEGPDRFSFNLPRSESHYAPFSGGLPAYIEASDSVVALLEGYQNETQVTELWKWFVIFALLFAVAEVLLQKFLR